MINSAQNFISLQTYSSPFVNVLLPKNLGIKKINDLHNYLVSIAIKVCTTFGLHVRVVQISQTFGLHLVHKSVRHVYFR